MTAPRTASCPTCNVALSESDRFCKQCGTEVSGVNASIIAGAANAGPSQQFSALSAASPWELVLARLREVTLGEFDIGRELGRGGMAAVFLAHDLALNRKVAIKVMAPGLMMGEGMVQRFRQEAITIANLSHAHIVTIHAVRQLADLHFFVMQFVEGQSLDTVLRTHGTLSVPVVKAILHQVGSALAYAHRRGVVHRDIKPGNILLSGDGDALVTDFGIAKVAEGPSQTQTGMVVGTPTYMSPEQCYATDLDGASDQYSLGVVAYQMLTGEAPFSGSAFAIMKGHTNETVPPIRARFPDVPEQLEAAILRMLAKKPADRFSTFSEALAAMGAAAVAPESPLRDELIRLAAVEERREQLGELLRTPSSPVPKSRTSRRAGADAADATPRTPATPLPAGPTIAIAIAPLAADLEVGDSATLRASVRGTSSADALVWSSETPDVVTVHAQTGEVVAASAGEAIVTAHIDGVTERITFRVVEPRVATLQISGPGGDVHVGESFTLTAAAMNKRGEPLERDVAWSAVGSAAELSPSGALRLVATGRVAITAVCEGVYETIVLHVAPAPVASINILAPAEPLEIARAVTLTAQLRDAQGTELHHRTVQWRVSDTALARIDAAGVLNPLAQGTLQVVAECEGVQATIPLVIPPARAATITIGRVPELVRDGDRFTLNAEARDARGAIITPVLHWSSSNSDVASVTADGAVYARTAGRAEIVVRADDVTASVLLTVHATPAVFAAAQSGAAPVLDAPNATAVLSALDGEGKRTGAAGGATGDAAAAGATGQVSPATAGGGRRLPSWLYAAVAVPVVGLVLWMATRGNDGATSAPPSNVNDPSPAAAGEQPVAGAAQSRPAEATTLATDSLLGAGDVTGDVASAAGADVSSAAPGAPARPVLRIETPASTSLRPTETLQLRATLRDPASGAPVNTAIRFASSNTSVARVDTRTGQVTAVAPGRVTISASAGDAARSTLTLSVLAPAAAQAAPAEPAAGQVAQTPPAADNAASSGNTAVTPPPATPPVTPPTREPERVAVSAAQLEQEARAVVNRFARAYESGNLSAVRAVYGDMPAGFASALQDFFEYARRIKVTVGTVEPIGALSGENGARASVQARVTIGFNDGRRDQSNSDTWQITLRRDGDRWQFVGLGTP